MIVENELLVKILIMKLLKIVILKVKDLFKFKVLLIKEKLKKLKFLEIFLGLKELRN
jgi:hypothetical protein